jgi:alpha-L-fucosidase
MARNIFLLLIIATAGLFAQSPPPQPVLPIPTANQIAWQSLELTCFLHFSVNTFTDKEWGYGDEPETVFRPSDFDAEQIVKVLRDAGFQGIILTCKHHDGFCLWPTKTTEHSVKNSKWKDGNGDVVAELSAACKKYGLRFGIYLSPWDRHEATYGMPAYVTLFRSQLRELLTNYGAVFEVWFDGANGGDGFYGGARTTRTIDRTTYYGWNDTWKLVRELQPRAVIFSDVGPDVRWVGNENGFAGETCWSMYSPVGEKGAAAAPGDVKAGEGVVGHRDGNSWMPPECDVSIRPGWFYHSNEDTMVKSGRELFEIYLRSVGRNGSMLLNVPPDRTGRINQVDMRALTEFRRIREGAFAHNLASTAHVSASSIRGKDPAYAPSNVFLSAAPRYWVSDDSLRTASIGMEWTDTQSINCVVLGEPIELGQRIDQFDLEAWMQGTWHALWHGTTVGHKRILRFPETNTSRLRLTITDCRSSPALSRFEVYQTPF